LQAFVHPPFADKQCETCHAPAKDGKVVLAQADVKAICGTCHDEKLKQIESSKVPHPGAAGDCTDCHNPHASKYPALPKSKPVDICLTCHSEQADMMKTAKALHQPVFVQGCAPRTARRRPPQAAPCGRQRALPGMPRSGYEAREVKDAKLVTIFGGKVSARGLLRKSDVFILPLKNGKGHPTPSHPTQDIRDLNAESRAGH
jgi:predicted CXXCH cytochrome family protein